MDNSLFQNIKLSQKEEQEIAQLPLEEILMIRKMKCIDKYDKIFKDIYQNNTRFDRLITYRDRPNHIVVRLNDNISLLTNSEFVEILNNHYHSKKSDILEFKREKRLLESIFGKPYDPPIMVRKVIVKTYHYGKGYKVADIYYHTFPY